MSKRDPKVEPGSIIEDRWGDQFRVLTVDDEEIWMQRIKPKPRKDVFYTRHVQWADFERHGYKLVFP